MSSVKTTKQLARSKRAKRHFRKLQVDEDDVEFKTQMLACTESEIESSGQRMNIDNNLAKLRKNCVQLARQGGTIFAFAPGGSRLWVPRHFFKTQHGPLMEGVQIEMRMWNMESHTFRYTRGAVKEYPSDVQGVYFEFVEMTLPERFVFQQVKSLPSMLEPFPRLAGITSVCMLKQPAPEDESVEFFPWFNTEKGIYQYSAYSSARDLAVPFSYTYPGNTVAGDCGALIVAFYGDGKMVVLGFHVGKRTRGMDSVGIAMPLFQEGYEEAFTVQVGPPGMVVPEEKLDLPESIKVIGKLLIPRGLVSKSQIKKTLLAKAHHPLVQGVTHAPAILNGQGKYSTFNLLCKAVTSIAPQGEKTRPFPKEVVDAVRAEMVANAVSRRKQTPPRLYTLEEALNGFGEMKRLSLDKTPGYPLDALRPKGEKGRAFLFYIAEDGSLSVKARELADMIEGLLEFQEGMPEPWVAYVLGLKDELRRLAKIDSPRLIMYTPVALTIVTRMMFGSWMESDRFDKGNASCVGINVDSDDWDYRIRLLKAGNFRHGSMADYSYFDSLSNDQVLEVFTEVTDAYYEGGEFDGFRALRHFILRNCMHCNMILGDFVLRKEVGGTTGNPLTVHWNNFMAEFFARCAFEGLSIRMGSTVEDHGCFDLEVHLAVYGDDNTDAISDKVVSWYNFVTKRDYFNEFGIVYTPSSKDVNDTRKSVPIDEIDFLSRKVRVDLKSELGVAHLSVPYKEDYRSLYWQSSKVDDAMALMQNATGICYRAVGLGSGDYNKERLKLQTALADIGVKALLPTWQDVAKNFRERLYNYTCDDARWTIYDTENSYGDLVLAQHVVMLKDPIPVLPSRFGTPDRDTFVVQADSLTNDAIVNQSASPETLAPPIHTKVEPVAKFSTVEDLLKRSHPIWNLGAQDVAIIRISDPFIAVATDTPGGKFGAAFFNYFGTVFRYWMGPVGLMVYGSNGTNFAQTTTVSYTSTLNSGDTIRQFTAQNSPVATWSGSMPVAVGQPNSSPMFAQVPAQHLGPNNLFLVPRTRSEITADYDANYYAGYWALGPISDGTRVYATVGDGFRLVFPTVIPFRSILSPPLGSEEKFQVQGAVTSKLDKGVRAVSGVYSNVKAVTDRAIDVAGKVSDEVVNFDTPNDGSSAKPVEPRQGFNMANMDGLRYAQVLGPMTGESPMYDIPTGTTRPETRLNILTMMDTLHTTVRVSTTDDVGTVLARIPITPAPDLLTRTTTGMFQPTMMEHVASAFTFWKGGINVTMQCVGPPLANMRIGIASRYGSFGDSVPLNLFSSQYGKVFNYGEEDTLKFWVPFISAADWLRVPTPDYNGIARGRLFDFALGEIVIVVITPYQVNETMAQFMDINIFLAGNEDLEFKTPGENLANLVYPSTITDKFEVQSLVTGAPGGEFNEDEKKEVDVRPMGGPVRTTTVADGPQGLWDRIYVIAEVPWDPSALQNIMLYSGAFPEDLLPMGPPTVVYNSFMLSRFTATLSFSLSTSVSSQGQLVAYFCPLGEDPNAKTLKEVLLLPHVLLKAGRTTAGILHIPFVHPLNALDIHSSAVFRRRLGSVAIKVFNQFAIGAGAPAQAPTVNLGIQFHNMELSIPFPEDTTVSQFIAISKP
jgi:hypothetical protein